MSVLQPKSRPPLERMMRIHHEIASGSYPNASTMARKYCALLAIAWDLLNVIPL